MNDSPIHVAGLIAGYGMLLIPLSILLWLKVPLVSGLVTGAVRMTVQLLLVGFYLKFVFKLNDPWINILWVLVMIVIADVSIVRGTELKLSKLMLPLFWALLAGTLVPLFYFVYFILQKVNLFDARFVIPIGGMILGNCLRADIIGIRRFYSAIRTGEKAYLQRLADGATLSEATRPYLRHTLQEALAPTLATMATTGLVSLPGMMTGVILAGEDPMTAIMYQIAIMIAIFTGTSITVLLIIRLSRKVCFDGWGVLRKDVFTSTGAKKRA
jgi:putative ABC transport system permease protein